MTSLGPLLSREVGLTGLLVVAELGGDTSLALHEVCVTGNPGSGRDMHELECERAEDARGSVALSSIRQPRALGQECSCLREETLSFLGVLGRVREVELHPGIVELDLLAAMVQRAAGGVGVWFASSPGSCGCEIAASLVRVRTGNVSEIPGLSEHVVRTVRRGLVDHAEALVDIAVELGARRGWSDQSPVRRGRCLVRVDGNQSVWRARRHEEVLGLAAALVGGTGLGMYEGVCYVLVEDPSEGAYRAMGRAERGWLLPGESVARAGELAALCEALRREQRGAGRRLGQLLPSARACLA